MTSSEWTAVVYIAKVRILKQITTIYDKKRYSYCCCLYSKGKNFKANHNLECIVLISTLAVVYIAKVRILKQITTKLREYYDVILLLFI